VGRLLGKAIRFSRFSDMSLNSGCIETYNTSCDTWPTNELTDFLRRFKARSSGTGTPFQFAPIANKAAESHYLERQYFVLIITI
jgi:hypothetical protein